MKILFFTRLFFPHIGGVEKHVYEVAKCLIKKGHEVTVITHNFDKKQKKIEYLDNIKIIRITYPEKKYIGLISIWYWLFKSRDLIKDSDMVHCHDVFIWYLPFRFFYPRKKVVNTIHGLEWYFPLRKMSIFQKRVLYRLASASVGIGNFLEKYLKIKFDLISYGASDHGNVHKKKETSIVYTGRLEENTGLLKFLKWLDKNSSYIVNFCGDGNLKEICKTYGTVHGFVNPLRFYENAKYCVPGGYLAALEALNAGCELKLFWNNKIKEDYWKMSPFYKLHGKKLHDWVKKQTWNKLTNEYLSLYNQVLNEKH